MSRLALLSGRLAPLAQTTRPLRRPVSVTKRCIRHWKPSKAICISTFTWRTTFCFLVQLPWRAKLRLVSSVLNSHHRRAQGDSERSTSHPAEGAGGECPETVDDICRHWPFLHALARDLSGC